MKNEGRLGKFMQTHLSPRRTDYHSFQDLSGKFFHSKAINFFNFLSPYKCRKSHFSMSDKRKNKSDSRAFEGNILYETGFEFRVTFSALWKVT